MAAIIVAVIGAFLVFVLTQRLEWAERRLAGAAYIAHCASALGQVWLHTRYYNGGDMITYLGTGQVIAKLLDFDFVRFLPEVLRLAAHAEHQLPFPVLGDGSSSGTMGALAGLLVYGLGDSVTAVCMFVGVATMLAQLAIYKAALTLFDEQWHGRVAIGILLVPSVVFWSSAFTKEAIALAFLGILLPAAIRLARSPKKGWVGLPIGVIGVGLVKPYILLPFVLATAAAAYVARSDRASGRRWPYVLAAVLIAGFGLVTISVVFPDFSPMALASTTAEHQNAGRMVETYGGSYTEMGDSTERSLGGQLQYLPLAAVNSLFRPMIFEARNAVLLAASFETTAVIVLLLRVLRLGVRRPLARIMSSPPLAFCAVFVITFGVAVGLATLNLGTLSRYRVPMMPFFGVLLFVLGRAEQRAVHPSHEPTRTNPLPE